ncbi:MAG: DUF1543 domain-containing protein [Sphingobacteriaceae bacterium]|nr:MAG: DUF1543 domain-containing protein [Sphingobacteriaceae bacterium]
MTEDLKLYMILLGSRAPGRHVEQHDYFFAIGTNLKELVPAMKAFWRGTSGNLHIDGWREVRAVDDYEVKVVLKSEVFTDTDEKLFFINLGGYQAGKLEEQHYTVLTVQTNRATAIQQAKKTVFFKTNTIVGMKGANSHIDDKYGIDVDDIYQIDDILIPEHRSKYHIQLTPASNLPDDEIHLGYFRLDKL